MSLRMNTRHAGSLSACWFVGLSGCLLLASCSVSEGEPSDSEGGTPLFDFDSEDEDEDEDAVEAGTTDDTDDTATDDDDDSVDDADDDAGADPAAEAGADDATDDDSSTDDAPGELPEQTGPFSVFDLGAYPLSEDGVDVVVNVAEGTESFALVVDGSAMPDDLMIAERLTSPSGEVFFDFEEDISINRTDATFGFYTLLVPTNPDVSVEPGQWTVRLRSGSESFDADVQLVTKNEPAADNALDLNLYFVGLDGFDATQAIDDENFVDVLEAVGDVYASIGISLGEITYNAIEGDDADTYGVIDSEEELGGLFQLAPPEASQALNLFFVADIAMGDAGLSTLGLAGGVPGPPTLQGTSRSGVAVNMGSFLAARGDSDADLLVAATDELEIIIAHESGHFLGLFHTVERNGLDLEGDIWGQDPLSDTALCPDSADADGNNRLSPSECEGQGADNLMFWSPPNDARNLTEQQGQVVRSNPAIR